MRRRDDSGGKRGPRGPADESAREEPSPQEEVRRGYNLALARVSVREYSRTELRQYLQRKGLAEEHAEAVVDELVRSRLVDDLRYAQAIVRHQALRKKGPAFIRAQLRRKGVDLGLHQVQALYRENVEQDEVALARSLVERKYPRAARDPQERRKAFAALMRRGFSSEVARRCLPPARPGAEVDLPDGELDELS